MLKHELIFSPSQKLMLFFNQLMKSSPVCVSLCCSGCCYHQDFTGIVMNDIHKQTNQVHKLWLIYPIYNVRNIMTHRKIPCEKGEGGRWCFNKYSFCTNVKDDKCWDLLQNSSAVTDT